MTTEDVFKAISDGFILNWVDTAVESSRMSLRTPIDSARKYQTLAGYYKQMIYSLSSFYYDTRFCACCEHEISEVINLISKYMEDSKKMGDLFDIMLKGDVEIEKASRQIRQIFWDIDNHVDAYYRETHPLDLESLRCEEDIK